MICSAMGVGCIIVWAISSFNIMKVFGLMWVIGGALTRGGGGGVCIISRKKAGNTSMAPNA